MKTHRSVLEMDATDARKFFLKPQSYCRLELPPYFDFGPVLDGVAGHLISKTLKSASTRVDQHAKVNHVIYTNKDGRYAWRPFQIIHPALYVDLVGSMTESKAWAHILARFKKFTADAKIECISLPVDSLTSRKNQATQILNWWQGIEQATIRSSLDFSYLYHADIADCYPSIYTHSVAWALHSKKKAKANKTDLNLVGNAIDRRLQDMQQGQTNGIPQGSVLIDFIAEIVLGYTDMLLSRKLKAMNVDDFKILRFRDDYRVLVNSPQHGDLILKALSEVLLEVGLKLSTNKTSSAQPVIPHAVKPDKKKWLRSRQADPSLQKHLHLIHCHATDFPNAGSSLRALDEFYVRLKAARRVVAIEEMIAVVTDIGFHSPRCFPVCAAIMSELLRRVAGNRQRLLMVDRIRKRLEQLPNNGHVEIWQQRLTYSINRKIKYRELLCRVVSGHSKTIWVSDWITDKKLKAAVDSPNIVSSVIVSKLKAVMRRSEYSLFIIES